MVEQHEWRLQDLAPEPEPAPWWKAPCEFVLGLLCCGAVLQISGEEFIRECGLRCGLALTVVCAVAAVGTAYLLGLAAGREKE